MKKYFRILVSYQAMNAILLQIPKVKLEFAKNGFFFMGARLYNSHPEGIRESADDFENKVNSYFCRL